MDKSTITEEIMYNIKKADTMRVILDKKDGTKLGFFLKIKVYNDTIDHFKEYNSFGASFGIGTFNHDKACFLVDMRRGGEAYGIGGLLSKLLKVDDKLFFTVIDDNNMYLEKAEIKKEKWDKEDGHHPDYNCLHNDKLYMSVYRKEKKIIDNLLLISEVYPDNSARPLRYNTYIITDK